MSFFVVPTFVPPTLEQLTREPDEVAIIVSQEARIAHELADVRDYNREAAPLGVIPVQEELVSEQDEGLTSDEDLTEEEDEAFEEDEEDDAM
ncbi:hypothetical protein D9Q98_006973 [Chlorella vulgaris]|uniref:Uncharacterized protein n=1 Tax=Chlorella vulgaris TaxID=3077 RepID=A0A9D4TJ99_CHLVU|nr:hypothetical protein D9Q98_006973 [Chlorella vulgaris]